MSDPTPADKAVAHVLNYVLRDPRVAYYIGPFTESLHLLCKAYAEANGLDAEQYQKEFQESLKIEKPQSTADERARCASIVKMARLGEMDGDLRTIIFNIESGDTLEEIKRLCGSGAE